MRLTLNDRASGTHRSEYTEEWYDQPGGDASPLADAIIDRIAHDSYRINSGHLISRFPKLRFHRTRIFNIRQQLPQFTPSAMTRIFKRLKVHGLIEKIPGSYKYLITALGKEIIDVGLTIKTSSLSLHLHLDLPWAEILPFCAENHL